MAMALALTGVLGWRAWGQPASPSLEVDALPANATVHKVVDGDTLEADVAGEHQPVVVRFLGIDTPESVKPSVPPQCFSTEASARTKELLPPNTRLYLVTDVEQRDHYGRLLAYVYRAPDGLFVNRSLVEEGYASILSMRPNTAHAVELSSAAIEAKAEGRGLWGACPSAKSRRVT